MILSTARLTLRPFTPADAPFILELLNQPSWIENIGDRGVRTEAAAVGYIENGPLASYHQHGFGLWCVERTKDRIPVGMCGILQRDYLDSPDIGFAYLERYQGQGFGTEAAEATIAYARETLHLDRMAAVVSPDNAASIRILRRLGMRYTEPILMPGDTEPIALYRLPGA